MSYWRKVWEACAGYVPFWIGLGLFATLMHECNKSRADECHAKGGVVIERQCVRLEIIP